MAHNEAKTPRTRAFFRADDSDPFSEDRGDIVFLTPLEACREIDRADRDDHTPLKRTPAWDEFAELGYVPPLELLRAGWRLPCWHCDREIDADDGLEDVTSSMRAVFCGQACFDAWTARRAEIHARKERLAKIAAECWPWAEISSAFNGSPGTCKCFGDDHENVAARLTFAGARVNNNHFCLGCGKLTICRGDYKAWKQAAAEYAAGLEGR